MTDLLTEARDAKWLDKILEDSHRVVSAAPVWMKSASYGVKLDAAIKERDAIQGRR
jgi:hypothetical protein